MKIQPQKLGLLCALTLCLAVGCKAIYVDKRSHPSSSFNPNGGTHTNDVLVNVHVTNEPPETVAIIFEATNSTPQLEVPIGVNVTATNLTPAVNLPLDLQIKTQSVGLVTLPVSIKAETESDPPLVLEITLSNKSSPPMVVPVKFQATSPESHGYRGLKGIARLFIYVLLLLLMGILGAIGGAVSDYLSWAKERKRDLKTPDRNLDYDKVLEGIFSAIAVPAVFYLIRRDLFSSEADIIMTWIVLLSGSLAAGLFGAETLSGLKRK